MTVAVDLVAVRRARDALRALTAAHPELTAAAAQDRAAAWMHDQEHNEMSRKLNDEQDSTAEQIGVRLPADLLARLDAEAARLSALTATPFTRSMVVRSVLSRALPMPAATHGPTSRDRNAPTAPTAPDTDTDTDTAASMRADIAALGLSARAIGREMTRAGFPVSGRAISTFAHGDTDRLPRWSADYRAWRARATP